MIIFYTIIGQEIMGAMSNDVIIYIFKSGDSVFSGLSFLCFLICLIEFILYSLVMKEYILSFFFWVDFFSILTLIFDV